MFNYVYEVRFNENGDIIKFETYDEAKEYVEKLFLEEKELTPFIYEIELYKGDDGIERRTGNDEIVWSYDSKEPEELSEPHEGEISEDDFIFFEDFDGLPDPMPIDKWYDSIPDIEIDENGAHFVESLNEDIENGEDGEDAVEFESAANPWWEDACYYLCKLGYVFIPHSALKDTLSHFSDIAAARKYGPAVGKSSADLEVKEGKDDWDLINIKGVSVPSNVSDQLDEELIEESDYNEIVEALSGKDVDEFIKLCDEIGIKDFRGLEAFKREYPGDLLTNLRKYRAELGDDFELPAEEKGLYREDYNENKDYLREIENFIISNKYNYNAFERGLEYPLTIEHFEDKWSEDPSEYSIMITPFVFDVDKLGYELMYTKFDLGEDDDEDKNPPTQYIDDSVESLIKFIPCSDECREKIIEKFHDQIKEFGLDEIESDEFVEELFGQLKEKRELKESQSQEISQIYRDLSKKFDIDLEDLVYGEDGFMNDRYPFGFDDFAGDVIYSEKYWNEFEEWLKDKYGINLSEKVEEALTTYPAESGQKLYGADCTIVPCQKYKIVSHSEDEKPLDCKMEKKPLEKPLTEEEK